ncbi:hypothetical protein KSP40_PGU013420 [Platanthera guangdongensis]|uniref:Transposase n=1 Tax=Platanthera guangdongensis TaxID=2320717 RepID=A0ABR2M7G0_9ASPA
MGCVPWCDRLPAGYGSWVRWPCEQPSARRGRISVLLEDQLAAEDLAAVEPSTVASHAAAAAATANIQPRRSPGRCTFSDEREIKVVPESVPNGSVVLGTQLQSLRNCGVLS